MGESEARNREKDGYRHMGGRTRMGTVGAEAGWGHRDGCGDVRMGASETGWGQRHGAQDRDK